MLRNAFSRLTPRLRKALATFKIIAADNATLFIISTMAENGCVQYSLLLEETGLFPSN